MPRHKCCDIVPTSKRRGERIGQRKTDFMRRPYARRHSFCSRRDKPVTVLSVRAPNFNLLCDEGANCRARLDSLARVAYALSGPTCESFAYDVLLENRGPMVFDMVLTVGLVAASQLWVQGINRDACTWSVSSEFPRGNVPVRSF